MEEHWDKYYNEESSASELEILHAKLQRAKENLDKTIQELLKYMYNKNIETDKKK